MTYFKSRYKMELQLLLYLLIFIYMITSPVYGISVVTFPRGTNVTLPFHHQLTNNDVEYSCSLSLPDSSQPFYYLNKLDPRGLQPGQDGRVSVQSQQSERNITHFVKISDLQISDEASYVLLIVEHTPQQNYKTYETFLEVTYPPGKAVCEVKTPTLHDGEYWQTVSCNATVGNDDHGYLACLQNNIQIPYLQPVRHHGMYMTATFWVDPKLDLRCCSTNNSTTEKDTCNQFVYHGQETTDTSLITNFFSTISPSSPATSQELFPNISIKNTLTGVCVPLVFITGCIVVVVLNKGLSKKRQQNAFQDYSYDEETNTFHFHYKEDSRNSASQENDENTLEHISMELNSDEHKGNYKKLLQDKTFGRDLSNIFLTKGIILKKITFASVHFYVSCSSDASRELLHQACDNGELASELIDVMVVHGIQISQDSRVNIHESLKPEKQGLITHDISQDRRVNIQEEVEPEKQGLISQDMRVIKDGISDRQLAVTDNKADSAQNSTDSRQKEAGGTFHFENESTGYKLVETEGTFIFKYKRRLSNAGLDYFFQLQQNDAEHCNGVIKQLESDTAFGNELRECFLKYGHRLTHIKFRKGGKSTEFWTTSFHGTDVIEEQLFQELENILDSDIKHVMVSHGIQVSQETKLKRTGQSYF